MNGFLYYIINETTQKRYIGITNDYHRRMIRHRTELNCNKHHSPKLQNAWNYYGEKDFIFGFKEIEVSCYDDLYDIEIAEIKKYDSYENGYNCNSGGRISDWKQKVKNENVIDFLCILSKYGDGYGKTCEEIFGWSKGTASSIKRRLHYLDAICEFEKLTSDEIKNRAIQLYEELDIQSRWLTRQLAQGGSAKAYQITKEDIYFAFYCQEQGIKYTPTSKYLGIKPATVKDWFNGRSRKKEKEEYLQLNENERSRLVGRFKTAELSGEPKSISY